jgi:hypothetical protein
MILPSGEKALALSIIGVYSVSYDHLTTPRLIETTLCGEVHFLCNRFGLQRHW